MFREAFLFTRNKGVWLMIVGTVTLVFGMCQSVLFGFNYLPLLGMIIIFVGFHRFSKHYWNKSIFEVLVHDVEYNSESKQLEEIW